MGGDHPGRVHAILDDVGRAAKTRRQFTHPGPSLAAPPPRYVLKGRQGAPGPRARSLGSLRILLDEERREPVEIGACPRGDPDFPLQRAERSSRAPSTY